ncbi:MAG TPA: sugar phosphate isomerase/epimerase [Candidatus Latescibacteria bacterium]|nr:sugar phosphate isomerase/epimerase [Candidatus Latescibacterota bacterium]
MSDASNQYDIKLGIYLGELQLPFEESLAAARDLGAQYVWCGAHSDNRALSELSDTEVDEAARLVDAHGLKFFFIDSGGMFKQVHLAELEKGKMLEHAQFKQHFDRLTRSMAVSARLGVGAVSCSSFAWPAEYTAGKPTWPMRWATRGGIIADVDMEKLVEAFALIAEAAEAHNVDVAFMMMQWNYTNTSGNLRRIFEAVGSPRLKAMWCPADNVNCGETDNATAGFQNLRPYLHGVHAKDLHTIDGSRLEFEYTPIGEGDVDYPTILQNLRDHNCDVVVSVATHFVPASGSRLEAMHTNFANLRRLIAETS